MIFIIFIIYILLYNRDDNFINAIKIFDNVHYY